MNDFGRPTLCKPEYRELAHNYCLLGATNAELVGFLGVAPRTIGNWIAAVPELRNRRRQTWQARPDDAGDGGGEGVDEVALLDAAGEWARRERE